MFVPEWLRNFAKEVGGQIIVSDDVGATLKDYRKRYGLTQKQMSQLIGLRRETISRIENNRTTPTVDFLQKFTSVIVVSEAIRAQRAKHREIEFPYIERLSKEMGINGDELQLIVGVALENYDHKREKVAEMLR